MKKTFTVTIKNKQTGKVYQEQVNSDDYILKEFEKKGVDVFNQNKLILNGERGIRTLDKVAPIQHFQCCAFNHSATSPKITILNLDHPILRGKLFEKDFHSYD